MRVRNRFEEMNAVFESGRVRPPVGETMPLRLDGIRKGRQKLVTG